MKLVVFLEDENCSQTLWNILCNLSIELGLMLNRLILHSNFYWVCCLQSSLKCSAVIGLADSDISKL